LTASGGAFRDLNKDQLKSVTAKDALKHPNWNMGAKITVDCATLVNKAFEVIEAKWLYNTDFDKINVIIHRESIIHSTVELLDSSVIAQLSYPTMEIPIELALNYPDRIYSGMKSLDFFELKSLTFEKEDAQSDPYKILLLQTLSDRLVEASAEWLHEQVRKKIWGFAKNEQLSVEDMKRSKYQGIRPAIGYPSLPDQSLIFEMKEILPLQKIGIEITENGAMFPASSVCGLIFSNPKSEYFMIKAISKEQFEDYAKRRGISADKLKRFVRVEIVE
jgi:hypothetical protein